MKLTNVKTVLRIRTNLLGLIAPFVISSCALFQPPCGEDCDARYLCNGLNERHINNEQLFNRYIKVSKNELVQFHCVWRVGLELPKGKGHWEKLIDKEKTIYDEPRKVNNKISSRYHAPHGGIY